ncbi:MAG TPA: tRNA epoxyqueuosine(34) reductase QueG [Terriglobia bacterium]|nr:tRNA epoxyqueuosine(34) reductase QueG [Terriglobia bacterium]
MAGIRVSRYDLQVSLSESLKTKGFEIGFDLVGIAPVDLWPEFEFSRQWVAAGFGGEMAYLANPKRDDPRGTLASAQSVVCVGLVYNAPLPYSTEAGNKESQQAAGPPEESTREPSAWISRYAWGKDYHEIMRAKLEEFRREIEILAPDAETRVYVDTGPVVERAFARYSGIGWTGKNTCLINEKKGSWFFLGVILTNLKLVPDLPAPDRCGSCTRCVEACPTDALRKPYTMDASRCIAYLTIELKGAIPAEFRPAIGNNVFGCDICQDVCPWNSRKVSGQQSAVSDQQDERRRGAATTNRPEFQPIEIEMAELGSVSGRTESSEPEGVPASDTSHLKSTSVSLFNPPLRTLASMSEEDFRRALAHSPIKRAKYRGWLRNLCVAIGNSKDRSFIPWLEGMANHPEAIVREHAQWALEQVTGNR